MVDKSNQELTAKFIDFFRSYYDDEIGQLAQRYPSEQRSLYIDYDDLYQFDVDLAEDYRSQPEQIREYAEEALRKYDLPANIKLGRAHVRVFNLPQSTDIRDIRVEDDHIGSLMSVKGIIRKATNVRPKIVESAFECQRCGTHNYIPQEDGDFQEPHECQGCERQGPFRINYDQSEFIDAQKVRVQESPEGLRGGEKPQNIDIHLEDDITGKVTAGDHVTIVGCLHIDQVDDESTMFDTYMDGVSVTVEDEEFEDMDIDQQDITEINNLSNQDDIYKQMVGSVAPAIYGYESEKLAMILQLFGGVTKDLPDGSRIRGDFHMLLIGDPGTGKSQLLSYIRNIAPRAVYTSGKGSSSAGLTAAAVRDDFGDGDQWTLSAGALVLADKGIAAVDELDKMDSSDRSAMHQALEQQEISINKAGINATLKSRCSLLGAANPKYGRFDNYEPVADQIDLEPALISRFDLIFTVTDEPDREHDENLADHILTTNYAGQLNSHRQNSVNDTYSQEEVDEVTEDVKPEIETELLRKYIAHAKSTCFPCMTKEAKNEIQEFYVNLRSEGADEDDPIPVTARKLEALVRLAEASARIRLSEEIQIEDAKRSVEIVESCLEDIGVDPETGDYDADIVETGTSKAQRDRIKDIKQLISDMEDEEGYESGVPKEDILDRAEEHNMKRSKAEDEIEKLRRKGTLYNPSNEGLRVV